MTTLEAFRLTIIALACVGAPYAIRLLMICIKLQKQAPRTSDRYVAHIFSQLSFAILLAVVGQGVLCGILFALHSAQSLIPGICNIITSLIIDIVLIRLFNVSQFLLQRNAEHLEECSASS